MVNLIVVNPNETTHIPLANEEEAVSSIEQKVDQLALDVVKESTASSVPPKKSIPERLEKNRKYAQEQQAQETAKGFVIKYEDIPEKFEVAIIYNAGIGKRTVDSQAMELQGRQIGHASCQGCRAGMEDESIAELQSFNVNGREYVYELLGIFDGHNGDSASKFVKANIAKYLKEGFESQNQEALSEEGIFKALKTSFIKMNLDYQEQSGTTATVAIILDGKIWVANTGDSRTIFVKQGQATQASEDAEPEMPRYKKTILKLGGMVQWNRVNGLLSVARAIGDKNITGYFSNVCCIIPNPKITCYALDEYKGGYLVLSCDGLYEAATTNEIGLAIAHMEKNGDNLQMMCKKLVYNAIRQGSNDNISIIIAKL